MKTVIITGGTGLVGKALTTHMLKKKYKVIVSSTKPTINFLSENRLENYSDDFHCLHLDYFNSDSMADFVNTLEKEKIYPEVIIHNARSLKSLKVEPNGKSSNQSFFAEFQMGVVGPYELNNLILDSNIGSKLKNIIFISSIYGIVAPTPKLYDNFEQQSPIQYGIAKAAQIHLTKEKITLYMTPISPNLQN